MQHFDPISETLSVLSLPACLNDSMGKMSLTFYHLLLYFASVLVLSKAESISLRPQPLDSFNLSLIQSVGSCSYKVVISTSCSSPVYTRDQISLSFGDAYGNQIYAPRLDNPSAKAFERCSSDTFQITGPCAYQICHLYLYRTGPDGWTPTTVLVYSQNSNPATFDFHTSIPSNVWYGFNFCGSASSVQPLQISGWLLYPLMAIVASLIM